MIILPKLGEKGYDLGIRTFGPLVTIESGISLAVDLPENRPENNPPEYLPDVVGSSSSVASPCLPSLMFERRSSITIKHLINRMVGCTLSSSLYQIKEVLSQNEKHAVNMKMFLPVTTNMIMMTPILSFGKESCGTIPTLVTA